MAITKLVSGAVKFLPVAAKAADKIVPIAEKAVDKFHEHRRDLVDLSVMVELGIEEAKAHLEKKGFVVHPVLLPPQDKYKNVVSDTVLSISPKKAKAHAGTLVKLYYVDQNTVDKSRKTSELINVVGMPLEKATDILEGLKLNVVAALAAPKKEYAEKKIDQVLEMKPAPSALLKNVKKGTVIALKYIDEVALEESQELQRAHQEKILARSEKLNERLIQVKKLIERKEPQVKKGGKKE